MSNNSRRSLWFWISAWLPVVLGIGVVVLESTELFGSNHTSQPLRRIFEAIFGHLPTNQWEVIHHLLRKAAHLIGYGLIGLAWLRAWWMTLPRSRFMTDALLALLGTALIASCDEWHQTFLPNRTGTPWDVLIDCTGAIILQLIVYFWMRSRNPARLERAA